MREEWGCWEVGEGSKVGTASAAWRKVGGMQEGAVERL